MSKLNALVSIHDVMPHTMEAVRELIALCNRCGVGTPTLLIVPGLDWTAAQVGQIRRWQDEGVELAGHGWVHQCSKVRTWYHRMHSLCLSRNVAEHLSLSSSEVIELMNRCAQWFDAQRMDCPSLYVPPAWALGQIGFDDLERQPFRWVETLQGIKRIRARDQRSLPLVGFEADTRLRQAFLTAFNRLNVWKSSADAPLRIGIHPRDHRLLLRSHLEQILSMPWNTMTYEGWIRTLENRDPVAV